MILVFGSINVDLIVPVPHLPEPGETVLGGDYAFLPGGKGGNQALAARRAGAAVMRITATRGPLPIRNIRLGRLPYPSFLLTPRMLMDGEPSRRNWQGVCLA